MFPTTYRLDNAFIGRRDRYGGRLDGIKVPPECPTAMARAIRALYHDKAVVEQSARQALRAAPQFSREQQARDLIHIFEQVVGIAPLSRRG